MVSPLDIFTRPSLQSAFINHEQRPDQCPFMSSCILMSHSTCGSVACTKWTTSDSRITTDACLYWFNKFDPSTSKPYKKYITYFVFSSVLMSVMSNTVTITEEKKHRNDVWLCWNVECVFCGMLKEDERVWNEDRTLGSSVIRWSDAFKLLLACSVPATRWRKHLHNCV